MPTSNIVDEYVFHCIDSTKFIYVVLSSFGIRHQLQFSDVDSIYVREEDAWKQAEALFNRFMENFEKLSEIDSSCFISRIYVDRVGVMIEYGGEEFLDRYYIDICRKSIHWPENW